MSIADPSTVEPLIKSLGDESADVRGASAWALEEIDDPRASDALLKGMEDSNPEVREAALWFFKSNGDPRATEPVAKALKDSNPRVRVAAAKTIGKLDSHRAVDPLIEALGDDEQEVRKATAEALEEIGEPLGRWIYDSLQGSRVAMASLAEKKDPRTLDPLVRALKNQDPHVRRAAVETLGEIQDPRGIRELVRMAGGWNWLDRLAAGKALFKMSGGRFPDLLLTVFKILVQPWSLIYLLCGLVFFSLLIYTAINWRKNPFSGFWFRLR
jgi:HEAT repeat protein